MLLTAKKYLWTAQKWRSCLSFSVTRCRSVFLFSLLRAFLWCTCHALNFSFSLSLSFPPSLLISTFSKYSSLFVFNHFFAQTHWIIFILELFTAVYHANLIFKYLLQHTIFNTSFSRFLLVVLLFFFLFFLAFDQSLVLICYFVLISLIALRYMWSHSLFNGLEAIQ